MVNKKKKRGGWGRYQRKRRRQEFFRMAGILLLAALLSLATKPELRERIKRDAGQLADEIEHYTAQPPEGVSQAPDSITQAPDGAEQASDSTARPPDAAAEGGLTVHYLDVEKCNCVLVRSADGHFMLIDAGSNDDAHTNKIVSYLQQQGVTELDYLLITHPHKDHIRAVPQILDYFSVNEVLMGEFAAETVGTKTYQRVLEALDAKDPLITNPQPGETYALGNASFTIIANDDSIETASENLNDCSIGLILTDGFHRFLFYGDGEEDMEKRLRESGYDLSCDVLMVAHHGSKSSSKKKTLQAAGPQLAVISCGIDGDGEKQEPSEKVLERLTECGAEIYRTDLNGTVVIESAENGLRVATEK